MSLTLVDRLHSHATGRPDAIAFRFLDDATLAPQDLSYAQLWRAAAGIAAELSARAAPGSRILLFFPPGLSYITAFYGCLLAGMVAVPLYPPRRNAKSDRIAGVARDCGAAIALTCASELAGVAAIWDEQNTAGLPLVFIATDAIAPADAVDAACPATAPESIAFLQYTSGSTGTPKGVIVTHANLAANCAHLTAMVPTSELDVFVNWVPPFHDLGLVMGVLVPVMLGALSVLMAPASFVRDPACWLRAITRYRGTRGGAPNFAFDLCVDKIGEAELAGLDLSSWQVAYNGAEPVRADTLERFAARFGACGFRAASFFPGYGMAEATLAISGPPVDAPARVLTVERAGLAEMRARPVPAGDAAGVPLVGCGAAPLPHQIRVVDPDSGVEAAPGQVGEIWFSGPSVSPGYWGMDELSRATFGNRLAGCGDARFLRTGDLGVLVDGELFVTGRMKDLIILRGRNHYPQDIELSAARAHAAVRPGHVAAFAVDEDGRERLVIVAELEREYFRSADTAEVIAAITQRVAREHEVAPERVVLLRPYRIPMTSSGKIRRRETRAMLADGSLESLAESCASKPAGRAPQGATEQALARIWAEVLRREAVGADQHFFEIGGDSLAALDVAARVDHDFPGVSMDAATLVDHPTIAALARWIEQAPTRACVLQARPSSYRCAPSLAQRRMLFLEELSGGSSYYNMPLAFRIDGPLDRPALRRALDELVAAHDVLRTVYVQEDGQPLQLVAPPAPFELIERSAASELELAAQLAADADHRFDLAAGVPLRVCLIALGPQQHVLSINLHHIAADGLSAHRLLADLGAAYRHHRSASAGNALARGWQYADFVEWQQAWLASPGCEAARAYWLDRLAGAPPLHGILPDRPRPPVQSVAGNHLRLPIPEPLTRAADALARAHGASPFAVYQAVFAALVARYSDGGDIVFGTAAANRQPARFADVVGLFVNTLVLRFAVAPQASFAALIEQAKAVGADALRHQQMPFDALVEQLRPERSLSYNPLVQLMLVMQDEDGQALELAGTSVQPCGQPQAVSKFDIALHLRRRGGAIVLDWEYSTELFEAGTIAAMAANFVHLLQACVEQTERPIAAVALPGTCIATAAVEQDLAGDAGEAHCVHHLFERFASAQPDAVALIEDDRATSYAALNAQAERVAAHLAQGGVTAGAAVGVCMEKSAALVVAMLAIYKLGAVYVPLDPHYPAERLAYMLDDARVTLLLVDGSADPATSLPRLDVRALAAAPAQGYPRGATPDGGAYIIYTSGSTGQPKGVLVTHANLYYSLHANRAAMALVPSDSMPTIGSQAFGVSLLEILLPLTSGGAVQLVTRAQVVDIEALVRATDAVTVLHAVPSLMRRWLDVLEAGHTTAYPHLRLLLVGGESVPAGLLRRIKAWRPQVRVLALYGMTESSIVCASFEATLDGSAAAAHYGIGKPYRHARFYVIGSAGQEQPDGVPGELHIGGLSVAAGYVGRPQMTAERFIASPFHPGERLYRTGDRVRRLADGSFEFLGRLDHQVSLRGARIELGEIETLAGGVDGVSQAVAHVAGEDPVLVLYYTSPRPAAEQADIVAALRAQCARRLPDYMRPSIVQQLPAFALNPNGKVDRKQLPAPQALDAMTAPQNDIERRLLAISHALLERSDFGVTANFFEVGGHSLLATRMATRIRAEFGIDFPLAALFSSPSVRACAAVVEQGLKERIAASMAQAGQIDAAKSDEVLL